MKIKPLFDNILLEPIKEEKVTQTGIIIPDTAEGEKPQQARVLAVGEGKLNDKGERVPITVRVGNLVLFKKYGPDEIKIKDDTGKDVEYLICKEDDILAIIE